MNNIICCRMPPDSHKNEIWCTVLKERECSGSQFICKQHFNEHDLIKTSSGIRLKQNTIPSIFSSDDSTAAYVYVGETSLTSDCVLQDTDEEPQADEINYWKEQTELLLIKMETLLMENQELKNELIMIKSGAQNIWPSDSCEKNGSIVLLAK